LHCQKPAATILATAGAGRNQSFPMAIIVARCINDRSKVALRKQKKKLGIA